MFPRIHLNDTFNIDRCYEDEKLRILALPTQGYRVQASQTPTRWP